MILSFQPRMSRKLQQPATLSLLRNPLYYSPFFYIMKCMDLGYTYCSRLRHVQQYLEFQHIGLLDPNIIYIIHLSS